MKKVKHVVDDCLKVKHMVDFTKVEHEIYTLMIAHGPISRWANEPIGTWAHWPLGTWVHGLTGPLDHETMGPLMSNKAA